MGLFSRHEPKIKVQQTKKDGFSGWIKCKGCEELIHYKELEKNLKCCPKCNYHYRLTLQERIQSLTDEGSFSPLFNDIVSIDPLHFQDSIPYTERLKGAQKGDRTRDGVTVGVARLNQLSIALGVMDFDFLGGSMGSVVGERITCLIEYAIQYKLPVIMVCASGGARMQESVLSLMQMAKTSSALAILHEQGLPYITILTNPTTGGVTASFASLGDIIIAEPKALICFAGPRVIEQTIKHKLPEEAQKSEFLLEKGMIDAIVPRQELKQKLGFILKFLINVKLSDSIKNVLDQVSVK